LTLHPLLLPVKCYRNK